MNETLHNPRRFFDFGQWPIVVARMPGFEHFSMTDWIAGFDAALDRNEAFVAVLDIAGFLKDPRENHDDQKLATKWLKIRRADYKRLCKGNVYVVADPATRAKVIAETSAQGRAFGFPFVGAATEAEALEIARDLLAQ